MRAIQPLFMQPSIAAGCRTTGLLHLGHSTSERIGVWQNSHAGTAIGSAETAIRTFPTISESIERGCHRSSNSACGRLCEGPDDGSWKTTFLLSRPASTE